MNSQETSFTCRLQPKKIKDSLRIWQFQLPKVIFLDSCGYLKILKSLPGPIKAFTAVRFQAPRGPSLSLLTLHGHHLRHLRRTFVYMSHKKPTAALLEPQGYWAESKSSSEEPPRRIFWWISAPCWLKRILLHRLLFPWMLHVEHGSVTHSSREPVGGFKLHHPFHPSSSFGFHQWHGGIFLKQCTFFSTGKRPPLTAVLTLSEA